MNKRETVQALADSVQPGEFEDTKSVLADDFQFMTTLQLGGAHSGSFDLTNMNMSVISVTHKAFSIKGISKADSQKP
jgi:hypothetical protein